MNVRLLIGCAALFLLLHDTADARRRRHILDAEERGAQDACLRHRPCRERVAKAAVLSNVDLWSDALKEYQGAYALKPVPWLLFNIARVLHKLERLDEARQYYRRYLDANRQAESEHSQLARTYLAQLSRSTPVAAPAPRLSLVPLPAAKTAVPSREPLHKQGWFWGVVGVVGAVVTVAVIDGAVAATR
jgi:tetratricopeptide (TPR) repeat protein